MKQDNILIPPANIPIYVLLADDDEDDRHFFERVLSEIEIDTHLTQVINGEALMKYLLKNPDMLPAILFLDFNMPRKNGLECLSEISMNEKLKHLPVIIYTTSLQEEIADLLYDKGAYYYIRKTDLVELKKCLLHIRTSIKDNTFVKPAREEFIMNFLEV